MQGTTVYFFLVLAAVEDSITPTMLMTAAGGILTVMTGAVTALWKVIQSRQARVEEKLDKCEAKHESKDNWSIEVSRELGELKGLLTGHQEARSDIQAIVEHVVPTVARMDETLALIDTKLDGLTDAAAG